MERTSRALGRSATWLFLASMALLGGCDPMKRHVVYSVTSKANAVDITSVDAYGDSDEQVIKPPWRLAFLAVPHSLLSITAQAMGPRGGVTCEITVDGKPLQHAASTGVDSTAVCSAQSP